MILKYMLCITSHGVGIIIAFIAATPPSFCDVLMISVYGEKVKLNK